QRNVRDDSQEPTGHDPERGPQRWITQASAEPLLFLEVGVDLTPPRVSAFGRQAARVVGDPAAGHADGQRQRRVHGVAGAVSGLSIAPTLSAVRAVARAVSPAAVTR